MDLIRVSAYAVDGTNPIVYDWSINPGLTGAYFKSTSLAGAALIGFPSGNGQTVTVTVTARHNGVVGDVFQPALTQTQKEVLRLLGVPLSVYTIAAAG